MPPGLAVYGLIVALTLICITLLAALGQLTPEALGVIVALGGAASAALHYRNGEKP